MTGGAPGAVGAGAGAGAGEEEEQRVLSIGDVVTLFNVEQRGFLFSDGICDSSTYLAKNQPAPSGGGGGGGGFERPPRQYGNCLFEVCPMLQYTAQKQMHKTQKAIARLAEEQAAAAKRGARGLHHHMHRTNEGAGDSGEAAEGERKARLRHLKESLRTLSEAVAKECRVNAASMEEKLGTARQDFAGTLFQIERAALHSYGPDPHSC